MGNEVPRHESADRSDLEVRGLNRRSLASATEPPFRRPVGGAANQSYSRTKKTEFIALV